MKKDQGCCGFALVSVAIRYLKVFPRGLSNTKKETSVRREAPVNTRKVIVRHWKRHVST